MAHMHAVLPSCPYWLHIYASCSNIKFAAWQQAFTHKRPALGLATQVVLDSPNCATPSKREMFT